jgi:hypothetical protein
MEFRAPSQLGKRPRGYVPDDVAARRGGGGGGSDEEGSDEEGAAPRTGTERVVHAMLKAEAAQKAAQKGGKSVTFAEPAEAEVEEGAIRQACGAAAAVVRTCSACAPPLTRALPRAERGGEGCSAPRAATTRRQRRAPRQRSRAAQPTLARGHAAHPGAAAHA